MLILQHNRGKWNGRELVCRSWGYFINLGFKAAQGKYICMLSDDVILIPGAILNSFDQFEKGMKAAQKIGAIAFYWREIPPIKGNKYWVGLINGKVFINHGMFLRSAVEEVGYIDENNYQFYFADGDLCFKLCNEGYYCLPADNSFAEHFSHAGTSVRKENYSFADTDKEQFEKRWGIIDYSSFPLNMEREYIDRTKTHKKYYRLSPIKTFLNQLRRKKREENN